MPSLAVWASLLHTVTAGHGSQPRGELVWCYALTGELLTCQRLPGPDCVHIITYVCTMVRNNTPTRCVIKESKYPSYREQVLLALCRML